MPLNLGPDFEKAVAVMAGIDPAGFYPGSLDIAVINPDSTAKTAVTFLAQAGVPTAQLKALIASMVKV